MADLWVMIPKAGFERMVGFGEVIFKMDRYLKFKKGKWTDI